MDAPAVARLSGPGEILAALPSLCGFPPTESLVVLSLRGPRRRVGLTARLDLPRIEDERPVATLCADRMRGDRARQVVLAVYSDSCRRESLVDAVGEACREHRIDVLEALHVAQGRWTSYTCSAACCPSSGTPLPATTAALDLLATERVATGRVLLASREDLVRSVAPPVLLARAEAEQRLLEASATWARHRLEHGAEASRRGTLDHARALLDRVADGVPVGATDAALLTVGLSDVLARDGLATMLITRSDELLSLLLQVARQVPPPDDAPVCALLAWAAYSRGDGALANVALDRTLAGTPDHTLALLLRECLDSGVPPDEVRALARGTAALLRRRSSRRTRRR